MDFGNIKIIGDTLSLPKKSQIELDALTNVDAGMLVWNTDELAVYQFNGTGFGLEMCTPTATTGRIDFTSTGYVAP